MPEKEEEPWRLQITLSSRHWGRRGRPKPSWTLEPMSGPGRSLPWAWSTSRQRARWSSTSTRARYRRPPRRAMRGPRKVSKAARLSGGVSTSSRSTPSSPRTAYCSTIYSRAKGQRSHSASSCGGLHLRWMLSRPIGVAPTYSCSTTQLHTAVRWHSRRWQTCRFRCHLPLERALMLAQLNGSSPSSRPWTEAIRSDRNNRF